MNRKFNLLEIKRATIQLNLCSRRRDIRRFEEDYLKFALQDFEKVGIKMKARGEDLVVVDICTRTRT